MIKKEKEEKVVMFFSALADKTRIKILTSLIKESKTVGEIHRDLGERITLSGISHQLKILRNASIIEYEKDGREKTFSLSSKFCFCILKDAMKHFGQNFPKKCCSRSNLR